MKSILRIFFRTEGTKPVIVLVCLVIAGFAEIIGITTLLPVLTELTGGMRENSSTANRLALDFVASLGITPTIGNLLIFIVAILCAKAVITFFALSYVGYKVAEVAVTMRAKLLEKLLTVQWDYYSGQKVGRISNAMSYDATRAELAFMTAAKFVSQAVQAGVYIIIAILVDWRLALAGVAVGGGVSLALGFLTNVTWRAGNRLTDHTSQLVIAVSDTLNNVKALRTMNRHSAFSGFFKKRLNSLRRTIFKLSLTRETMVYGRELIVVICMGIMIFFAAVIWEVPLSELVVTSVVFFNVIAVIGRMQIKLRSAVELESAYYRLKELTDEADRRAEVHTGTRAPTLAKACVFENVSFGLGGEPILHDVSFEIPAGSITVLQGPSGAGKTTLIDILTGLYRPDSGQVLIDGHPLDEIDMKQWRLGIGYVPQEMNLMHDTIWWNVTMGEDRFSSEAVHAALTQADLDDTIARLPEGVDTVVGERGLRFSGGERQRIALARALVSHPRLLILDEVTSALDPETELAICENIQRLAGQYTIVAITHRPAWADIATHLYTIDAGKVSQVDLKAQSLETT